MSNAILNSALTGEADFAGAVLGRSQETAEPVVEQAPATPDAEKAAEQPPVKEVVKQEEKTKVPTRDVEEKTKKTEDVDIAKQTEKATEKSEDKTEELVSSDSDLPVNPHFNDKEVADKPSGDDSEKGLSSWKEHKAELKKAREERDRLAAELKAAKEAASTTSSFEAENYKKEIEDYKTKIAELSRELKTANFERSPEYVERVKKPLNGLQGDLRAIAEANDADFGKLWQAVTEPDIRKRTDSLEDLIGDFKRMEQIEVVKLAEKYHNLASEHERFQRDAESLVENEKARKAQEEQEFIENDLRLQKVFTSKTWTNFEDRHNFLKEVDGQDDWNNHIRSARKTAAEINLDRLSVEERSSILAKASVVPFLESAISHYSTQLAKVSEAKNAEIAELKKQIEGLVGASPSLGTSTTEAQEPEEDIDDKSLTNFGATLLRR
jgi:hypothetical protein